VSAAWRFLPVLGAPALHGPVRSGAVVAFAVVAGELPNSFVKRRLGVAPGAQRWVVLSLLDQADFVLLAAPLLRLSARDTAECFAVVALAHLPINVAGRLIGARDSAI
jgi:hypothetical protein